MLLKSIESFFLFRSEGPFRLKGSKPIRRKDP